jgi:ABC-type branched-subunit amino acid transport system substrate-binding protein
VGAFAAARGATVVDVPAPAGTADWRPVLERLRAAQADAVWLGLPAAEAPGFLGEHTQAGIGGELVVLEPDVAASVAMPANGLRPQMWHHTLEKYSARELNNRHRRRFGEPLDGASWSAWAAVKLVAEGLLRRGATPQALLEYLESDPPFDGHKGRALTFRRSDHQLRQPMYLVRPEKADAPATETFEVPRGADLDALFATPADSGCLKS